MDSENASLEDSGITMVDVLKEEEEMEKDAEAVLGAGDDTICTYDKGYMKRQALYGCLTCCPINEEVMAGVCLGCSYHCHEGHELVELYTKRKFRCDCGNSKMKGSCKLSENKEEINSQNSYNQNFIGKYCICHRPYPDPEDNTDDEMIQCILCEDWYHGRHLTSNGIPEDDDYSEMICHLCYPKYDFLRFYVGYAVEKVKKDSASNLDVSVNEGNSAMSNVVEEQKKDVNSEGCKISNINISDISIQALFFPENWRKHLCKCDKCNNMYSEKGVEFIVNEDDTVSSYECEGKAKANNYRGQTPEQREIDLLSNLDRITRTEVLHEYNNLSSSLREYLKKFAENGKVVRDEDVREFFADLAAKKRHRQDPGIPYFCK